MTGACDGGYRHSRYPVGLRVTCPVCGRMVTVAMSQLFGWPVYPPHADPRHPRNWTQLQLPFGDAASVLASPDPNQ